MKYFSIENIIFACVIAGALASLIGLWLHNVIVFSVGIVVGGILPTILAEIWSNR